jgi:hypothetical protein
MRIPIEPLKPLDTLTPADVEVPDLDPVIATRSIRSNLPRLSGEGRAEHPGAGRPDETPEAPEPPAADYQGEDRRQGERRSEGKSALLDTRVRPDRRRQSAMSRIDLKV